MPGEEIEAVQMARVEATRARKAAATSPANPAPDKAKPRTWKCSPAGGASEERTGGRGCSPPGASKLMLPRAETWRDQMDAPSVDLAYAAVTTPAPPRAACESGVQLDA
jgi:hypothetical protein